MNLSLQKVLVKNVIVLVVEQALVTAKLQDAVIKDKKARSGGGVRLGFEGGQLPLFRRIPKRGFTNINRKEFAIVNLDVLNRFEDGTEVTPELLVETGIIRNEKSGIKILSNGNIEKKLTVKANKFSAAAKEAIEAAGGKTEVI